MRTTMVKTIIKIVFCLSMFVCFTNTAQAFVFSDVPAIAQRAAEFIKSAQRHIETATHYRKVVEYAREFNAYKQQFQSFQNSFDRVYRKIKSGDYTRAFDISKWDWRNLDDHILRTWTTWNQASWDLQKLILQAGKLYETNPAYKRYADRLAALGDEKAERAKREEASIRNLERRHEEYKVDLNKLRETNRELTEGNTDDINGAQLQALNNQILLLQTLIQAEEKTIEDQRQKLEKSVFNDLMEIQKATQELHKDDGRNFEFILEKTLNR